MSKDKEIQPIDYESYENRKNNLNKSLKGLKFCYDEHSWTIKKVALISSPDRYGYCDVYVDPEEPCLIYFTLPIKEDLLNTFFEMSVPLTLVKDDFTKYKHRIEECSVGENFLNHL